MVLAVVYHIAGGITAQYYFCYAYYQNFCLLFDKTCNAKMENQLIEQKPETPEQPGSSRTAEGMRNWVPWTTQQTFYGVILTLVPWVAFNLMLVALGGNQALNKPLSFSEDLAAAIVQIIFTFLLEGAFLIAPYYYARKALSAEATAEGGVSKGAIFKALGLRGFDVPGALLWIIGMMVVIIGVDWLYSYAITAWHLNIQTNDQVVLQNGQYAPLTTYATLACATFIAPFFEEIYFRGFLFTGLLRDLSPVWAVLISSALFAIAHADPGSFIPLFVIGLALAFVRWRTGSTWASMSLHVLNNLLSSISIILAMHSVNLPF